VTAKYIYISNTTYSAGRKSSGRVTLLTWHHEGPTKTSVSAKRSETAREKSSQKFRATRRMSKAKQQIYIDML